MVDPMSPRFLLVLGVIVLLVLAAAVALAGRIVRSRLGDTSTYRRQGNGAEGNGRAWAVTPLPMGVARALTARGLVNAQQLASMSPAEREFFVATVAARVGETGKPKLMPGRPPTDGVDAAPVGDAGVAAAAPQDATLTAALVSGGIHCPVCRAPLGQRTETPLLMSRCPGCGRRVGVRVEGARLTVTVQYGNPTPGGGVGVQA
jgi:hypothetical protein